MSAVLERKDVFVKQKFAINENLRTADHTIWFRNCSKSSINQKLMVTLKRHHCQTFSSFGVLFVKFSHWYKFHVSIIIRYGVLTTFVCKILTRIHEIGIHPSKFCPISEDWSKLGIANLAGTFLMRSYLRLQNAIFLVFLFLSY